MQNSVVYGILMTLLTSREKVSRKFLAEKYEISERTVRRYIDALSGGDIPIQTIRGKNGGYTIADNYRIDHSFFTPDEYDRLLTCVGALSSFDDDRNRNIIDKLRQLSQSLDHEQYLLKSDTLVIDSGTWANPHYYRGKIETINHSIADGVTLNMRYIDRNETASERLFDPYSLILKEGVWYVYGWCHERSDFRLFKLSRIRSLYLTDTPYQKRPSDVYGKLNEKFENARQIELHIEFSPSIESDVEEWLGTEVITRKKGDVMTAQALVYSSGSLLKKLLSFGSAVRVVSPAYLQEELLTECKRVLVAYGVE